MPVFGKKKRRLVSCALLLFAAGVGAAAQPVPHVEDNIIVSELKPSLAIEVDKGFTYLGRHPIRIRDVAAGERLVFAELQEHRARRLFIIQIEGFLPGIDNEYRYNLTRSPVVAGYPFRSNSFAFDLDKSVAGNPGGESASTQKFLLDRGIAAPKQWMMWRSLTVTSADKRNEMILFYVENVFDHDITISDIYDPDTNKDTPVWKTMQIDLEQRANASYRLARLNEDKQPLQGSWQRVPLSLTP